MECYFVCIIDSVFRLSINPESVELPGSSDDKRISKTCTLNNGGHTTHKTVFTSEECEHIQNNTLQEAYTQPVDIQKTLQLDNSSVQSFKANTFDTTQEPSNICINKTATPVAGITSYVLTAVSLCCRPPDYY